MNILGISAFYHDSAATIMQNGEVIAAAQEERFSRKKHDPRFPHQAINYCLEEAEIEPDEIDATVFYDNPLLTLDRVIKNTLMMGKPTQPQFEKAAASFLSVKLHVQDYVQRSIGSLGKVGHLLYTEHHMAHAASAFYPSPFKDAAVITLDGVGEWATTTIGHGQDNKLSLLQEIRYPHSLGLIYSAFTYFCGFKVNSGEYKLMGLAPYGRPKYTQQIKDHLIDIKPDGSFRLNTDYFGYLDSLTMTNDKFASLFGGLARTPESQITHLEMDLAASIQAVTEEVVLKIARYAREKTQSKNLVMAGGVALNCVANGKIVKEKIFDHIWIQPAAGDAGGALGSALMVHHGYFGNPRKLAPNGRDTQKGSYLGPSYQSNEIQAFLDRQGYPYEKQSDLKARMNTIAQSINEGKVIGYFAGRMEFGPRALGARSIIGDPRGTETQLVMNQKIKFRESFRPFAPSVLFDEVKNYFDLEIESPYMLLVADVKQERRLPNTIESFWNSDGDMRQLINEARSDVPAITHVDYSARVQSVHPEDKPDYYELIKAFKELTGCGLVVNTSFNVRGEPIVCSPQDAYTCFMRTHIDVLVLEDCILHKDKQPKFSDEEDWKTSYELD